MAFFKEKRTGNLGTVTAVDWGRSIGKSLNYDALNKYYQRKFDQKIKDLELTPQVFDTTLSFLEPKIQSKVLELQNEYKSNADISYRKSDFSDAAINARQRNAEILKELANMEAGIKSLEEAEAEFANNPDAFFPHEINSNLSGNESILREAYMELINGDYKTGNADVVKDVYFKNGKTIVNIEGVGDIELNELRPYDQPKQGLYSSFTTQFADIATTSSTNTAEASALLTKMLGSIDNDLNYSDIQDLLDFKITIPSQFSGIMKGTLRLKDDDEFRTLFEEFVENAGDYTDNWQSFFNPEVRREQKMELKAGVDQSAIVQGVERFVRGFVERVGNQFITAGAAIQKKKKDDELAFEEEKAAARFKQTRLGQEQEALKQYYNAVTNTVLTNFGTDRQVFNEDGSIADVDKYREIWMEELVNQVGDSNKIIATMGYDRALNYFMTNQDIRAALNDKLAESGVMIESQLGEPVKKAMTGLFEAAYNPEVEMGNNLVKRLTNAGLLVEKPKDEDNVTNYFQLTDLFLKALTEGNLMKPQLQTKYNELTKLKFYRGSYKEDFAGLLDFMREIMFNRYTDGTQYENTSNIFTIQKDGSIKGYGGDPTTEAGKILLGESLLSADLLDIKDVSVASGLGDMNP